MDDMTREKGKYCSGQIDLNHLASSKEDLYTLLCPLERLKLADLLAQLGSKYPFLAEEIRSVARADPALRKLFVRGFDSNTTSETLSAAFEVHGEIQECTVIFDKTTGRSKGYGFITYKDMESAQKAVKAPGVMVDGRIAVCRLASEGSSSNTTTFDQVQRKLYVYGLSPETTSDMLLNFFGRHGEIEEGSVAYEKDSKKPRGFGFITYKTVESAMKAIEDPDKMLGGRNVTVKFADNRKGTDTQTQLPSSIVPFPVGMAALYPHAHRVPSASMTPVGYTYPQIMAAYPSNGYTNPHVVAALHPLQPRITYPPNFAFSKFPWIQHPPEGTHTMHQCSDK